MSYKNSLVITNDYPADKYNVLVPIRTVAEIAEIQRPVMNVVYISTNLKDKEIYEQEKARIDRNGQEVPPKYAIAKKGLTKLMIAAGIKISDSRPIVPSTCQKCANINAGIGKAVRCGACSNKDVKYEVRISVPQLTGENIEIVAHKEIIVDDAIVGMSDRQITEFLKFRNEMCETKALNRALRSAMQIKSTYFLEELKKPFVVAYLVPNLDNAAVKEKAVEAFFSSSKELYRGNSEKANRKTVYVEDDSEEKNYEEKQTTIDGRTLHAEPTENTPTDVETVPTENGSVDPNICTGCGNKISNGVSDFSIEKYGVPLCMSCQRQRGRNQ